MGYAMKKVDIKGEEYSITIEALVDTGSAITAINSDQARALESHGLGDISLVGPRGEPIPGWLAFGTIRVVGTPLTARQKMVVINKMSFSLSALLGADFFAAAKMAGNIKEIDIPCDSCGKKIDQCQCTWLPFQVQGQQAAQPQAPPQPQQYPQQGQDPYSQQPGQYPPQPPQY